MLKFVWSYLFVISLFAGIDFSQLITEDSEPDNLESQISFADSLLFSGVDELFVFELDEEEDSLHSHSLFDRILGNNNICLRGSNAGKIRTSTTSFIHRIQLSPYYLNLPPPSIS